MTSNLTYLLNWQCGVRIKHTAIVSILALGSLISSHIQRGTNLHSKESFEDRRTVGGHLCAAFKKFTRKSDLSAEDSEWGEAPDQSGTIQNNGE